MRKDDQRLEQPSFRLKPWEKPAYLRVLKQGSLRRVHRGSGLVGHVGEFMGSTAIAMVAPDKHYIMVVTCNLSNPNLVKVLVDLQKRIR